MPHLTLSMPSGDDRILKRRSAGFARRCSLLRQARRSGPTSSSGRSHRRLPDRNRGPVREPPSGGTADDPFLPVFPYSRRTGTRRA